MIPEPDAAVRLALELGADHAAEQVRASVGRPVRVGVGRFVRTPFAVFPDGAPLDPSDEMASTVCSFHGPLSGAVVISMEPEHALKTIPPMHGPEAVEAVREMGTAIGRAFTEALVGDVAHRVDWDRVSLREGTSVGAVLETHAPPDTAVLSTELGFEVDGEAFPAFLYVLLDAKLLEQLSRP